MKDKVRVRQLATVSINRNRSTIPNVLKPCGKFHIEHYRKGKLLQEFDIDNMITDEGKDALLNIMFHAATQITTWYLAPIKNQAGAGVQADDTYTNILQAGNEWDESNDYDEANRIEFVEAVAASQQINNSANKAVFTMDATLAVEGIMVVGGGTAASTKDDNAGGGTLWSTALFAADVNVEDDDVLTVTYTCSV